MKSKWYICSLIEEFRFEGLRRRGVWVNTHLIRAVSPRHAFNKAMKLGSTFNRRYLNAKNKTVTVRFRGLIDLLPVYEPLRDGSEIMWTDYGNISEQQIKKLITPKKKLQVFKKKQKK